MSSAVPSKRFKSKTDEAAYWDEIEKVLTAHGTPRPKYQGAELPPERRLLRDIRALIQDLKATHARESVVDLPSGPLTMRVTETRGPKRHDTWRVP